MGSFGGFFKGEKKKKKKNPTGAGVGFAPVFTLPEVISKKRLEK